MSSQGQHPLPPLEGADVVDFGCGAGDFARRAVALGARHVLALDLSPHELDRARALGDGEGRIHFEQADLAQVSLPFDSFDLAHSAVRRLADANRFARMVRAGLRVGGHLVLTVEHPGLVGALLTTVIRAGFDLRHVADEEIDPTGRPRTLRITAVARSRAWLPDDHGRGR